MQKEKVIVSSSVLLASLLAYWYARSVNKDTVPYLLIGGFAGSVAGELIATGQDKTKNRKHKQLENGNTNK